MKLITKVMMMMCLFIAPSVPLQFGIRRGCKHPEDKKYYTSAFIRRLYIKYKNIVVCKMAPRVRERIWELPLSKDMKNQSTHSHLIGLNLWTVISLKKPDAFSISNTWCVEQAEASLIENNTWKEKESSLIVGERSEAVVIYRRTVEQWIQLLKCRHGW